MTPNILDTGVKFVKNVGSFNVGMGCLAELANHVLKQRERAVANEGLPKAIFLIDEFFLSRPDIVTRLQVEPMDLLEFIRTGDEPTTDGIDQLMIRLKAASFDQPATIVGMGGGTTLDTTKAVANLLTNGGKAAQYQGWDLVRVPAVYKIGVPTLSGTGAEATRTCVMVNPETGLKLGMNSDYTVFDHVILDPDLTATAPRDQYFYTGMDAYLHCVESLAGRYRNAVGDAYSRETINLCRQVFLSDDMMHPESRSALMVASYLGGCAIATGYVGIIHPFSAGLSAVLGLHHCVANCIAMRAMEEFYPESYREFWQLVKQQNVTIPEKVCRDLTDEQYAQLYTSTVIHQKPLINALGENFRAILTQGKVKEIFQRM